MKKPATVEEAKATPKLTQFEIKPAQEPLSLSFNLVEFDEPEQEKTPFLKTLGRLLFQPLSENPLLGPSASTAERPELLTVILPQSLKKHPPEIQELLSKVMRQPQCEILGEAVELAASNRVLKQCILPFNKITLQTSLINLLHNGSGGGKTPNFQSISWSYLF